MKKVLALIPVLLLIIILSACAPPKPELRIYDSYNNISPPEGMRIAEVAVRSYKRYGLEFGDNAKENDVRLLCGEAGSGVEAEYADMDFSYNGDGIVALYFLFFVTAEQAEGELTAVIEGVSYPLVLADAP